MKMKNLKRRIFLKQLSHTLLFSCGSLIMPSFVRGESAFEYALAGQNHIQQKNYQKAVEVLNKAVEMDPSSDWAFGLLGRAYYGAGKEAEAVTAFRSAVRINPGDTFSRMMIEIITQKPIAAAKKEPRPLSPLEKEAQEEERAMLKRIQSQKNLDYQVRRVVIDAGHGGFDPGAVGPSGLKEKEVTLDLALKLHDKLKKQGAVKPFLTRTGDYYIPLSARTVIANQHQADLFISIHINANENRSADGSETYYCSEKASSAEAQKVAEYENSVLKYDEPHAKKTGYIDIEDILFRFEQKLNWSESGNFAQIFQNRFKQQLPLKSRGVHSANFYVLRRAKMPSILLETGFISNVDNEAMLKQPAFREKIVDAVVQGLA